MDCKKVRKLLSQYIDKETASKENIFIEQHLNSCHLCASELSELSRIKNIVCEKERKVLPPDYLIQRLREKIYNKRQAKEKFSWLADIGSFSRNFIPVPVAVIAFALIVLFLAPNYSSNNDSLENRMLSGGSITTQTALELVLGTQD